MVEMIVNLTIQRNLPVTTQVMPREEAFQQDAIALFEERYGDKVRLVTVGDGVSRELCGGTHVHATGDIGVFLIVSEGAVSSGVRRIEALTGEGAIKEIQSKTDNLKTIANMLKTTPEQLIARVEHIINEQKEQEREIESLKSRLASRQSEELMGTAREVNGVRVISQEITVHTPKDLREFGDHLKDKLSSGIIVLGARGDGKVFLLCRVTPDLIERFHAGRIISKLAPLVGGKGGGRKDMAEGGGTKVSALKDALSKAYELIEAV